MRAPLILGGVAMAVLAALLAFDSPSPGALSAPHAALSRLQRLSGCEQCHAEGGLSAGCLGCHVEIAAQIEGGEGSHAPRADCTGCHPEHQGERFDLLGNVAWRGQRGLEHDRVPFALNGKHEELACERCHDATFSLPAFPDRKRARTFLGKTQACDSCHEDVHGGFPACRDCHGQEGFKPAVRFDHAKRFPLLGGHTETDCQGCHTSLSQVRGKTCAACHDNPHQTEWGKTCEECHAADRPRWTGARIPAALHETTGFSLARPHDKVTCAACHAVARFPVPARAQDDCRACHDDVHNGEFEADCLDCHERTRFVPARYGKADHSTFPLRGAHARTDCQACHKKQGEKPRRFSDTPQSCRACHEDIHQGQFGEAKCGACHGEERFQPSTYDLARHDTFALKNRHRAVSCAACHKGQPRRFTETTRSCKQCHRDPHAGQFGKPECTTCHRADARDFSVKPFDHDRQYPLQAAHAEASCNDCHRGAPRRYRGTPTACATCHEDVHRGQFRAGKVTRCERCHTSRRTFAIQRFDHDRLTRYRLDRTHAEVACSGCHPSVRQPDKTLVTQYKPIGTRCRDCHEPR